MNVKDNIEQQALKVKDNDDQSTVLVGEIVGNNDASDNEFKHNFCVGNKIHVMKKNADQFGVGPGTIGTVTCCTALFVLFVTKMGFILSLLFQMYPEYKHHFWWNQQSDKAYFPVQQASVRIPFYSDLSQ